MTDLNDYKQLYLHTASEYVKTLQKIFLHFASDSSTAQSDIELLHRSAHSLKGQSLVMGYQSTGRLAMMLEYIFRAIKDGNLQLSDELKPLLEDSLQKLYDSIESIKNSGQEATLDTQTEVLSKVSHIDIKS